MGKAGAGAARPRLDPQAAVPLGPHDPLRDMEAAIVELEPLSEEAALEYVQPSETRTTPAANPQRRGRSGDGP
jgi:hypothetical protein